MTVRNWGIVGAGAVVIVALWHGAGSGETPEPIPATTSGIASSGALKPQGAGSCSATACHGRITPADPSESPSRVLRNEHSTWVSQDRHADAYQVLFSPRSRSIAANLSGGKIAAHEDHRCLACHATTTADPRSASSRTILNDGVSCESCHGASERWLGAHTQGWWTSLDDAAKQSRFGMTPTKGLGQRAAVCVGCHVGAPAHDGLPARNVDHDLIAAGHPRLAFEFASFLANMPPHWVEDTRGSFPARVWAVGQVAAGKAALDQLQDRAERAAVRKEHGSDASWPEFSEYDCFSCHHGLADEAWRKHAAAPDVPPGIPQWGSWYFTMVPTLAGLTAPPDRAALEARFRSLRTAMNRSEPVPETVASESRAASEALGRWLRGMSDGPRADAPMLERAIDSLETPAARSSVMSWDHAAQRYMALQPLRLSRKDLDPRWNDAALRDELYGLFRRLQFPRGFDSPRWFNPRVPGDRRSPNPP